MKRTSVLNLVLFSIALLIAFGVGMSVLYAQQLEAERLAERRRAEAEQARDEADHGAEWRPVLEQYFSVVRVFDAATATLGAPDDALLGSVIVKHFADRQVDVSPALVAYLEASGRLDSDGLDRLFEVYGETTDTALVRHALEQIGVRYTFGIPGVHNIELYDELLGSESITPVLVTHEGGGAFMADAISRATDTIGVLAIVPAAGITHSLSGVGEAFLDGVPMLIVSGGVRTDMKQSFQLHDVDQQADDEAQRPGDQQSEQRALVGARRQQHGQEEPTQKSRRAENEGPFQRPFPRRNSCAQHAVDVLRRVAPLVEDQHAQALLAAALRPFRPAVHGLNALGGLTTGRLQLPAGAGPGEGERSPDLLSRDGPQLQRTAGRRAAGRRPRAPAPSGGAGSCAARH